VVSKTEEKKLQQCVHLPITNSERDARDFESLWSVIPYLFQHLMNALASKPSVLRQSSTVLLFEFSMVTLRMEGEIEVQNPRRVRCDAVSVPYTR
jgi:hypothetical protein